MPRYTFRGPQEYVFPHQHALEGAAGSLVLTPGESYDFGTGPDGQPARPVGPAWWWDPEPPAEKTPAAPPEPATPPAPAKAAPLADAYSDSYDGGPAAAGAEG